MRLLCAKITYLKLGLLAPNRHEPDPPNEMPNIDFGQGAAKMSMVKVEG